MHQVARGGVAEVAVAILGRGGANTCALVIHKKHSLWAATRIAWTQLLNVNNCLSECADGKTCIPLESVRLIPWNREARKPCDGYEMIDLKTKLGALGWRTGDDLVLECKNPQTGRWQSEEQRRVREDKADAVAQALIEETASDAAKARAKAKSKSDKHRNKKMRKLSDQKHDATPAKTAQTEE